MINHAETNIHWPFQNSEEIDTYNLSCHTRNAIQNMKEILYVLQFRERGNRT